MRYQEEVSKRQLDFGKCSVIGRCFICSAKHEKEQSIFMTETKHTQVYPIITDFVSSHLTDVTSLLHTATPFCVTSEKAER